MVTIEKQIRQDTPQVSVPPYKQIHAHSTGNPSSTAQNEADYMNSKDLSSGFYTHVVGNGRIIQTARTNRGSWDVGGSWNNKTYAAVELIESHKTQAEFDRDYKIYIQLLRDLAIEAGIPIKVDCGEIGINSHYYCTYNQPNNKSDHTDPYPYLQKWGISKAQFKADVENGFPSSTNVPNQTIKNKGGVATMYALYFVNNKAYFYNGVTFGYVNNPDGLKIIRQVYRDNNGKDIPEYHWKDGARFDLRLTQPILDADKIKEKFGLKNEWD